jgi:hypothetical protein
MKSAYRANVWIMDTVFLTTSFHLVSTDGVTICGTTLKCYLSQAKQDAEHAVCFMKYCIDYQSGTVHGSIDANIVQSPLGLMLGWTGRTSIEKAAALQMARAARMPVYKVLSGGEHPDAPSIGFSRY